MTRIALSITHAAHRPERVASLARLTEQLRPRIGVLANYHIESGRMPHWEWSRRQWEWAAGCGGATHGLFLQDDVTVCEDFHGVTQRIAEAAGDRIVALHSNHAAAAKIRATGANWYTSSDGLVGTAYLLSLAQLRALLLFRERAIVDVTEINEDTLIDLYAMATGQRIYHAIPSPIDHDTTLPSTWGADGDDLRRPIAGIEPGMGAIDWTIPGNPPHVGRVYRGNHWRLLGDVHPGAWTTLDIVAKAYAVAREPWTTEAP